MIAEIAPHPGPSGKRTPWVEVRGSRLESDHLVVSGPSAQQVSLPLRGSDPVTGLVFANTNSLDQYGGVFDQAILFVTRQRRVLCTTPGKGWDQGELQDFARAAGLDYRAETFANHLKQDAAYPRVPSAVDLRESSRSFRPLGLALGLGVPLIVAVVVVLLLAL